MFKKNTHTPILIYTNQQNEDIADEIDDSNYRVVNEPFHTRVTSTTNPLLDVTLVSVSLMHSID